MKNFAKSALFVLSLLLIGSPLSAAPHDNEPLTAVERDMMLAHELHAEIEKDIEDRAAISKELVDERAERLFSIRAKTKDLLNTLSTSECLFVEAVRMGHYKVDNLRGFLRAAAFSVQARSRVIQVLDSLEEALLLFVVDNINDLEGVAEYLFPPS